MIFQDETTLNAPIQDVWDLLLDVDRFATLLPGTESLTKIDERTFDGLMVATIGPISGKFAYRAHIEESDPPTALKASVAGTDSVTKSQVTADVAMTLTPLGADVTRLCYSASVDVRGRLAIVGDRILRGTATMVLAEFTRRLQHRLTMDLSR